MPTQRTTIALSCGGTIAGFRSDAAADPQESLRALSSISSRIRAFEGDRPISASVAVDGTVSRFSEPRAPERVASALANLVRPGSDRLNESGWDVFQSGAPTTSATTVRARSHSADADTLELPVQKTSFANRETQRR